jgi:hypothetical protein
VINSDKYLYREAITVYNKGNEGSGRKRTRRGTGIEQNIIL